MYLIVLKHQLEIVLIMTNCTIYVQCSTWYKTALLSATSLDKIKQLMRAWLLLRANLVMYNIYLLNKSREKLRCGYAVVLLQNIFINLRSILVNNKTLILALDMMWWWSYVDISEKNDHDYCYNMFTSVQLLKDLLACKIYCNGTMWVNKKYLPECICKPARIICGTNKSHQDGSSNMVATVWQDNRM